MKQNLYEYYQQIRTISTDRIKLQDNKDYIELMIKTTSWKVRMFIAIKLAIASQNNYLFERYGPEAVEFY